MEISADIIMKNLGTFTHAYGLEPNSKKLVEDIYHGKVRVERVGILLRDPVTKEGLISCDFPVNIDATGKMIWISIDGKTVEAVPIYTREAKPDLRLKNAWKKFNEENLYNVHYYLIEEDDFKLRVHHSFCKKGVIEKYLASEGYGFISRNRKGIFFLNQWCNFNLIREGKEVSFIPIISRKGLQARAIEEVKK